MTVRAGDINGGRERWAQVYRDLHAHPELAFAETRTAELVATTLAGLGLDVTTAVGGTGVVGMLRNGPGPTALLRADMDALPVQEATGLPYASTATGLDADGAQVAVMHACGHDMHVACLLGACEELAATPGTWSGTLMAVFQPAEEAGSGARAMLDDGLYTRFTRPVVVLGQHVAPLPAGVIGLHPGAAFAASDSVRITLHGRGAHGSRPEASVDPVVMAAATVLRLQTIVSRELAASESAVVTVGSIRAGSAANVIPDQAELGLSVRTSDPKVRERVLAAIERIVRGEAAAAGAPREPVVEMVGATPAVVNDASASARTGAALAAVAAMVVDPGPVTGSEDVGLLATEADAPCVYWLLGCADPGLFAGATTLAQIEGRVRDIPSNHSPQFAPVVDPTLGNGIAALAAAARTWLQP
jgi:amidohydrolase